MLLSLHILWIFLNSNVFISSSSPSSSSSSSFHSCSPSPDTSTTCIRQPTSSSPPSHDVSNPLFKDIISDPNFYPTLKILSKHYQPEIAKLSEKIIDAFLYHPPPSPNRERKEDNEEEEEEEDGSEGRVEGEHSEIRELNEELDHLPPYLHLQLPYSEDDENEEQLGSRKGRKEGKEENKEKGEGNDFLFYVTAAEQAGLSLLSDSASSVVLELMKKG